MTEQPASDYDGAWKAALDVYLQEFLELCFPAIHAAIDWSRPYRFLKLNSSVRAAPHTAVAEPSINWSKSGGVMVPPPRVVLPARPECQLVPPAALGDASLAAENLSSKASQHHEADAVSAHDNYPDSKRGTPQLPGSARGASRAATPDCTIWWHPLATSADCNP